MKGANDILFPFEIALRVQETRRTTPLRSDRLRPETILLCQVRLQFPPYRMDIHQRGADGLFIASFRGEAWPRPKRIRSMSSSLPCRIRRVRRSTGGWVFSPR